MWGFQEVKAGGRGGHVATSLFCVCGPESRGVRPAGKLPNHVQILNMQITTKGDKYLNWNSQMGANGRGTQHKRIRKASSFLKAVRKGEELEK